MALGSSLRTGAFEESSVRPKALLERTEVHILVGPMHSAPARPIDDGGSDPGIGIEVTDSVLVHQESPSDPSARRRIQPPSDERSTIRTIGVRPRCGSRYEGQRGLDPREPSPGSTKSPVEPRISPALDNPRTEHLLEPCPSPGGQAHAPSSSGV